MLRACAVVLSLCTALPVWADARISVLMDVMQIDDVVDILHAEGLEHGARLNVEMLDGQGGPVWNEHVRQLYDRNIMTTGIRDALTKGLNDPEIEIVIAFFASDAGTDLIGSENQARRAMGDPNLASAARELVSQTRREDPDVYDLVAAFIEANDLIDNNVSGAMSQQYRFFKGLSDGGYDTRSDDEILDDIWAMHDPIVADTTDWLYAYLMLAYLQIPKEDLRAYIAFSESEAGKALNSALFEGFDIIYRDISYGLGRAIALHAASDEI